jgi:hypothetical protein
MSDITLGTSIDDLLRAVEQRDEQAYEAAFPRIADAALQARPEQVQEGLLRLAPLLAEIPFGIGGDLAQLAGGMAEYGTDPTQLLPTLVGRAVDAMEQAARFAGVYREAFGDPPDPQDHARIESAFERVVGGAAGLGLTEEEAVTQVQAWFCADQWVQPVLFLAQRKDVRAALPQRRRLTDAVEAVREHVGTAHWLYGLLLVLDDEPLVVLHRPTGRGYRVTVSGIGDNFQLHTLLAAALVGDGSAGLLPGRRPTPAEVAAAGDGEDLEPEGGLRGSFNLVDGHGAWIWNEGRPADIPALDGARVVVLDPPPYERAWNAGRPYPLMRPEVRVEALTPAEAAHWLGLVKPAQR